MPGPFGLEPRGSNVRNARHRTIRDLIDDFDDKESIYHDVVVPSAELWIKRMVQDVPVDTGALQQSIKNNGVTRISDLAAEVKTGPGKNNRFYGKFVEEGSSKNIAQPFMEPQIPEVESEIKRRFKEFIQNRVKR